MKFHLGQRVRIRIPRMTLVAGDTSEYGTVMEINGGYILTHPDHWPSDRRFAFYPNELEHVTEEPLLL